ncbi:hypothetical protein [Flavobacterium orientale]|uniref:Uncharacterized protein n=1 Tax=Flavobacterium orientale TaxID=1756020 RepID=A0A916Y1X9_9FLAO|nr:hypothetical protein [Flavobacterium orientale]GGD26749.1 hypothetical protein GCM10011343_16240 [Flavobacterium orientale]
MKKKLIILSILFLAFYSHGQHIKTPTFEILFPLAPQFQETTIPTEAGDSTLKMVQLQYLKE